MMPEHNIVPCFSTPIVNCHWNDCAALNAELTDTILKLEGTQPGIQRSNVGGWHSDLEFLGHDCDTVKELSDRLHAFSHSLQTKFTGQVTKSTRSSARLEAWANVLRRGQYNSVHCHPNALWSMVYYVTGNPSLAAHPYSGKLELLDPRPAASITTNDHSTLYPRLLINPSPGQVIAFPAWLQHLVHPLFSDSPRISIAVNLLP